MFLDAERVLALSSICESEVGLSGDLGAASSFPNREEGVMVLSEEDDSLPSDTTASCGDTTKLRELGGCGRRPL